MHHLLGLAVILVLILPPVGDDLLHLAVEGGEQALPLLILALQTRQHQGQEGLLAQQGHAAAQRPGGGLTKYNFHCLELLSVSF